MKRDLSGIAAVLCAAAMVFVSCSPGGDGSDDNRQIVLSDPADKTQTAYADGQTTGSFTFTTKSAWTATVTETTPATRFAANTAAGSGGVSWLRLLNGGQAISSGGAGEFTLAIELDPNYTGQKRSAAITIAVTGGGAGITIAVTQEGTTETGEVPKDPSPYADYFGTWIARGTGEYEGVWESATISGERLVYKSSTDGDVYTLTNLVWTAVNLPEDDTNGDGVIDGRDNTGYSAGYKITGTLAANPAGRNIAKAEGTGYASVGEQAADWWYIRAADKGALMRAMWAEPTPGSSYTSITGPFARHTGELPAGQ